MMMVPILASAEGQRTDVRSQHDFVLNIGKRTIVQERLLGGLGRRRVRVTNSLDPQAFFQFENLIIPTHDYGSNAPPLHFAFGYRAVCSPGNETKLVQALGFDDNSVAILHRHLQIWVSTFVERQAQPLLDDLPRRLEELKQDIIQQAREALGLTLQLQIRLDQSGIEPTLRFGPREIAFHVGGGAQRWPIQVEVIMPLDDRLLVRTLRRQAEAGRFDDLLVSKLEEFFEKHATLHDVIHYADQQVARGLERFLEPWVASWGRRIQRLRLKDLSGDTNLQQQVRAEHEFDHELAEYPTPVHVKCSFLLTLEDAGRYVTGGKPDLQEWARKKVLEKATKVLFSLRYSELIRSLDDKKAEIRRLMKEAAQEIGYGIDQLITLTNLPMDILREPFTPAPIRGQFATCDPNVLVGLEAVFSARIIEAARIEPMLDRGRDVPADIRELVRETLTNALHGVDPEEFYLHFFTVFARDDKSHQEILEDRLRRQIRKALQAKFGAELLQVVFKQTDSDVTRLLVELRRAPYELKLTVFPRGGIHEKVTFDAWMTVDGLARDESQGWNNFLTKQPGVDRLINTIRNAVEGRLEETPVEELMTLQGDAICVAINEWARKRIGKEYGLAVRILDLRRLPTLTEQARVTSLEDDVQMNSDLIRLARDEVKHRVGDQFKMEAEQRGAALSRLQDLNKRLVQETDPVIIEELEERIRTATKHLQIPANEDPFESALPASMKRRLMVEPQSAFKPRTVSLLPKGKKPRLTEGERE